MRSNIFKPILSKSGAAAYVLLLASGAAFAQSVDLTAAPVNAALPDGQSVPMWGYVCGKDTDNKSTARGQASCAASNPHAGASWSPVLITVPYSPAGTSLTINLKNGLSFSNGNSVPTSLMIVGQLGGGLGGLDAPTSKTDSPKHLPQGTTWPGTLGPTTGPGAAPFTPPDQPRRVQSFGTEVLPGATTALTWNNLRPGTYLIESGTHPSIQGPMGLYGVLVVTTPATGGSAPQAYPGVSYDADLPLLLSEIDPVQNAAVSLAVNTAGFTETAVWSALTGNCGDPAVHSCYPPAVNYDPRYYLINGVSFDRAAQENSSSPSLAATPRTGHVLVRFVNAGLRMHVPTIVGALTGDAPGVSGFSLIAEDGNVLPGIPRVQSEVFLAAGKTYDVMINAPPSGSPALPVFDRQLSLSTNNGRGGGMLSYISVNGGLLPTASVTASAFDETYYCVAGTPLVVSDPGKGVLANDRNANGATLGAVSLAGGAASLAFQSNGTFTYNAPAGGCGGTFAYLVNGTTAATATITQCDAGNHAGCSLAGGPTANPDSYASAIATRLQVSPPGVLANDTDPTGLPLTVDTTTIAKTGGNAANLTVSVAPDGSFTASATTPGTYTFTYQAKNSQNTPSATAATVTVSFPTQSGLTVHVRDAKTQAEIGDYRWIIEEDRSFYVNPATINDGTSTVATLGTNFHTAHMPVVAQGCVGPISCEAGQTFLDPISGNHVNAVCDIGNGVCHAGDQQAQVTPAEVGLDPNKRYYISIMPGDGVNTTIGGSTGPVPVDPNNPDGAQRPFDIAKDCGTYPAGTDANPSAWTAGDPNSMCGHVMGGAQVPAGTGAKTVNVVLQQAPLPTAKISVMVYEDDSPLNGENDAGGGVDVLAPNEPGLEGFNLVILDQGGTLGDSTGQITYDMFNMPVSNSLANMPDPVTGHDACPINKKGDGIVGVIPVCPKYEDDGKTLSPLAGQAVIANLYPGLYEIAASPGADRIARGEEWLQTSTLDGTKPIEAFIKAGEPAYFQEFGPGGYHVALGFANPAIIKGRKTTASGGVCSAGQACNVTIHGHVTNLHMSRTPDQRVYSSGDYTADGFTQCYASLGPADGPDFDFAKCDGDGTFTFSNVPAGDLRVTVFDQWNDLVVDGLSTPITVCDASNANCGSLPSNATHSQCTNSGAGPVCNYELAVTQWRTSLYTSTFIDQNGDGVRQDGEPGLPLASTNIRYRDGSIGFFNNTDLAGNAGFNEVFPLLNWLVVETDATRYKTTGVHVVNDAGGPVDCDPMDTTPCAPGGGQSAIANRVANSAESATANVPATLRIPGAVYCGDGDCTGATIKDTSGTACTAPGVPAGCNANYGLPSASPDHPSGGRIDPPWVASEGWQGLLGLGDFVEFGKQPYASGENGGIRGHVIYASTRPFDDPALLLQLSWEPGVPNVGLNLYQESTAADGSKTLKLVDTTTSTSFDDWAQGFRRNPDGTLALNPGDGRAIPNMSCPGVETSSPFYFTLQDSTETLNPNTPMAEHARFKCFDGWASLNQMQPAPYDGMYKFPSVVAKSSPSGLLPAGESFLELDPKTYRTNCTICTTNPDDGTPMLPPGRYVVEVVVPPGYELVKEEDKNILLGDVYVAPVTQQFAGLGNIFIMPDQAAVNAAYNPNNPGALNLTTNFGKPHHEGDTGSLEAFWPCAGALRTVPDFNSLYPGAGQQAPFAGATRPLCDRKEVILEDQMQVLAKFYVFSSAHVAGHFTGTITNDFASEFDPFSPQFGEKFAPPNLPVSLRDFNGNEMGRVYSDQWGLYNGLNYSSWGVNPPNPTGYVPQMMTACMNDPGPIPSGALDTSGKPVMIQDPAYNPAYSNFCYEIPFMPGQTAYLDTPVIPTMAFADNYNLPDCAYPDATPAIARVDHDVTAVPSPGNANTGPWVPSSGTHTLLITALGTQQVSNHAYSGPTAKKAPFNQRQIPRHYGFGADRGTVTIGVDSRGRPIPATITAWSDSSITVTVPNGGSDGNPTTVANRLPLCTVQQRGESQARCGELVITAANGKRSIDTVTVTVGGKTPTQVTPSTVFAHNYGRDDFGQTAANVLQTAIDNAVPGDLIMVGPGTYKEVLLMWKPVRLQGIGAASVTINADAHPAGKIDPWRRQVNCLFGLAINGRPLSEAGTEYDPTGVYSCPSGMRQKVDRIPFEAIVGWDTSGNGNLAQLLQEPTLMGAYEGAGITVLGRGMRIPADSTDFWGADNAGGFPTGAVYLTTGNADCAAARQSSDVRADYATSNFLCNPSRIDGLSVTNSSQGGGAVFLHAWSHNMEVGNTRIFANHGTLTGGITIGNGEFPDPYIVGGDAPPPYSVNSIYPVGQRPQTNEQAGYGFNRNVNVHHNAVTANASIGDALFSGTPSAAGGVTFCAGADFYKFNFNWICGNLSTGDGGGAAQAGFSDFGSIANNTIVFNQSANPTIPTHGGGLAILGASPDRTFTNGIECGNNASDVDCPPGLPEGTGRGLVIDANLIVGNSAESGSGGGLRLQSVNGQEIAAFPRSPDNWYSVSVTNNIIANNVAGWDGGGVSLQDALKVSFVNNTVAANDTTASAGVLFNTLGATLASTPAPGCTPTPDPSQPQSPSCINPVPDSTPQAAGLVTMANTPNLVAALPPDTGGTQVSCPSGYGYGANNQLNDGSCRRVSLPLLKNDLFWQNRAFHITVGAFGPTDKGQDQQHLVSLEPLLNQTFTGACATTGLDASGGQASVSYWDIGVRGDAGPTNHGSGFSLTTDNTSILSTGSDPGLMREYCNGARLPPENGGHGYLAPPGHSESTGLYPVFALNNITAAATVDEGNNWINLGYGPLALVNPVDNATILGNYGPSAGSPAVDPTGANTNANAPGHDFFGTARPQGSKADIGAVEFLRTNGSAASISPASLEFGYVTPGGSSTQTLTLHNNGSATLTGIAIQFASTNTPAQAPVPFVRPAGAAGGTCGPTLTVNAGTCTIIVRFTAPALASPKTLSGSTGMATVTVGNPNTVVSGSPVNLTGTSAAPPAMRITGGPLAFGNQSLGTTSAAKALTLTNTGGAPFTNLTVTFSNAAFLRPAGSAGGTCGTSLSAGDGTTTGVCTISVVFKPAAQGSVPTGTNVAITGNSAITNAPVTVTGSPVTLTGTGVPPQRPAVGTLDNFNRTDANTLGSNWLQATSNSNFLCGRAPPCALIRVNTQRATSVNLFGLPGYAMWGPTADFTAGQAAAFTFVSNTPASGSSLVLKGSGTAAMQVPQNFVRVRYVRTAGANDQVVVEYTTNNGMGFTTAGTLTVAGKFATGDTLTAWATSAGSVLAFRGNTFVGSVTLPNDPLWTSGGGQIGVQLPGSGTPRVDDFAGGAVP